MSELAQPARFAAERLTDRHYRSIAEIVQKQTGICLPPTKQTMVEGRLRKRVRALGLAGLNDYASLLFERGRLEEELVHIIDCVTTNKTDFFREPDHFEFLREVAVPALLAQNGRRPARLKVWSAAASIGAEAYTLAMVLQDMADAGPRFTFSILGTEVSTDVLTHARRGVYTKDMVAPVPADMALRYIMPARDSARPEVRIAPELRRLTRFEQLNLMDPHYPVDQDVDVIFCRNVLIYFDKATQKQVLDRLCNHLRPGGYIFVGHSESMAGGARAGLTQVLPTVFQA
ncbi:CheR family methyltransferase [Methylocapsa acidiphila]|uniref:CheR family methyltransferase n=1 Tax=Methylocapsa acidiphila TaxID=133552 RepID=UPI00040D6705|nr:CheR family methyltransferase [Methylocapsa acidiphila]